MCRVDWRTWLPLILLGGSWPPATGCFLATDLDCDNYPHPGCLHAGEQGGAAGDGGGIGGGEPDGGRGGDHDGADAGPGDGGDAEGGACSVILTTDKPAYMPGEDVRIGFLCAPGNNGSDWIGVYAYGPSGPTPADVGAYAWEYVDGSQTPGASPAMGQITITAASLGSSGKWPMKPGGYTAYYLPDDGYVAVASIDFQVQ